MYATAWKSAALLAFAPAALCLAAEPEGSAHRYAKGGLVVEFSAAPLAQAGPAKDGVMEDESAEVRFRITEEASGNPVRGLAPGAWMDIGEIIQAQSGGEQKSCKDKIALYLRGAVGIRPMLDLNSYFVLTLDREGTVTVVDPLVSMTGRTSTLARITLPRAGGDWARSTDQKRLFVTIPSRGEVAVIDTDQFKLVASIPAGIMPLRAVLQPDGRYLWVGNDSRAPDTSGVTVIDAETLKPLASLATGRGHHEIAHSNDSRWAFVSNRDEGTVSVIDVRSLKLAHTLKAGKQPISLAWSSLAQALYVADAQGGAVHVVRGEDMTETKTIALKQGLGPMRFTADGRWAMVANTAQDLVHVIDPSSQSVVHDIPVQGQPYQIVFTRAFAYVRALGSERVTMINLSSIGQGRKPIVQSFAAGAVAPRAAGELLIADSIAPATKEAAVLVVNPAENATYFYMEGMNASASNYKPYGASARAVMVIDRSLKEVEPGVYASRVKPPVAGRYDVAFTLNSPSMLHCFSVQAAPNPRLAGQREGVHVEYLVESREVPLGGDVPVRFRVTDNESGAAKTGLKDLLVLSYLVPGQRRNESFAKEIGEGVYETRVPVREAGAYTVHVSSKTLKKGYKDLPFMSIYTRRPDLDAELARRMAADPQR